MHIQTPRRVTVLVQHREPLVAAGVLSILSGRSDIFIVDPGEGDWQRRGPVIDVVITDYTDGVGMARQSRTGSGTSSSTRIMVVTPNDREQEVRFALESGVHGYLQLGCSADELVTAVRMLGQGLRYLGMEVSQRMADSLTRETLTARETEVLRLLATGLCNKSIASRLSIGVGTVKAHVRGIMGKLAASSRTQVVTIAAQRGLVHEPAPSVPATLPEESMNWSRSARTVASFTGALA